MHRIDDPSAVPALPAPRQAGTPGFFTQGSPTTGQQATIVTDDWANAVQEEIAYVVEQAGLALSKLDRTQLFQAIGRMTRIRLTANRTYYVSPTGNDYNDGLSPSTPWQSISAAYNYVRDHIDSAGYQVVIQLLDGTHASAWFSEPWTGGAMIIRGNTADPSRVIVSNTAGPAVVSTIGAQVQLDSFTVQATGPAGDYGAIGSGILCTNSGIVVMSNMHFGTCSLYQIDSRSSAVITMGGTNKSYSIVGGAAGHMFASGGYIATADATITLTGNPHFSTSYAFAAGGAGELDAWGCTFNGTATGVRYIGQRSASIIVQGAGPDYFPGDTAGYVDSTGAYYG